MAVSIRLQTTRHENGIKNETKLSLKIFLLRRFFRYSDDE